VAIASQVAMLALTGIYVALCIRSFAAARRARRVASRTNG
jgi:hypothetical protein